MTIFEVLNEPEVLSDGSPEPEVTEITVSSHSRKKKSKREDNLEGLPARIFEHTIDKEELYGRFPHGYKELPCEVYKRLSIIPKTFLVDEHRVHIYTSRNNDGIILKAKRPPDVFRNPIATLSLVAAIINGKYVNHIPLEQQSKCYKDNGIKLETNTLANWMINAADIHFSIIYDELHEHLLNAHLIHADETPFEVIKDGRRAGSNSYMWVYRSGKCDKLRPVILYDYQPTRKTDHPDSFLKGYSGFLMSDGYQVYHSLEKRRKGIKVAGCWVHAKRKFAGVVKAVGVDHADEVIAAEAAERISGIFHPDNSLDELSSSNRIKQRQLIVAPKVDDFFAWAKEAILKLSSQSATYKGLRYCLNQEQFLRVFLSDGDVPMDNNLAEQAIRPFTIGRKNRVNMYSTRGAEAGAIIYSLVETAKANGLSPLKYLEYLLTELPKHADDKKHDFLEELLPWSGTAQEKCHSLKKS